VGSSNKGFFEPCWTLNYKGKEGVGVKKGDPHWLDTHAELLDMHFEKSGGYGTGEDPLANFVAVAAANGKSPYMYALDRMTEKIARCRSLEAQGRIDELGEEFPDLAGLSICAEALRRRVL
jgi:hypothetical protein